jgi:methyltransferase-like protein 6
VAPGTADCATLVFVLSALSPDAMPRALRQLAATLRPGAQVLFRSGAPGRLDRRLLLLFAAYRQLQRQALEKQFRG